MRKPVLARSDNRLVLAKKHPYIGEPDDWLESAVSFDFFIDWNNYTVQKEIWVKRLLEKEEVPPETKVAEYIAANDNKFKDLCYFASSNGMDLHYMVFDDTKDWKNDCSPLYDLHLVSGRWVREEIALSVIKKRIIRLSGGEVKIGRKGLIYSTSNLEAALSTTGSLWPGDADGIILGKKDKKPLAILEYRKHNRDIDYESVRSYYANNSDRRKYDRLQLLSDAIKPGLPLIVVTYPTIDQLSELLLERVVINVRRNEMAVSESLRCPLPDRINGNRPYIKALVQLMHL